GVQLARSIPAAGYVKLFNLGCRIKTVGVADRIAFLLRYAVPFIYADTPVITRGTYFRYPPVGSCFITRFAVRVFRVFVIRGIIVQCLLLCVGYVICVASRCRVRQVLSGLPYVFLILNVGYDVLIIYRRSVFLYLLYG